MKSAYLVFLCFLISSCAQLTKNSRSSHHGIIIGSSAEGSKALDLVAAKRGQSLYESYCLKCHGKTGNGDGPLAAELDHKPISLKALVNSKPDFQFFLAISNEAKIMPGWNSKEFTNKELNDLTNYIKTFTSH